MVHIQSVVTHNKWLFHLGIHLKLPMIPNYPCLFLNKQAVRIASPQFSHFYASVLPFHISVQISWLTDDKKKILGGGEIQTPVQCADHCGAPW